MFAALALCVAAPACKKPKSWGGKQLDSSVVEVATDRLHLRHVKVGMEIQFTKVATVVMVDVRNKHTKDVSITMTGKLHDKGSAVVGTLRRESLRVPAGQWRLFALVDSENQERKNAAGASVSVAGVHELEFPQEIVIRNPRRYKDGERIIVQAEVHNAGKAFGRSLVMASFYDKEGTPLARAFSEVRLGIGETTPVQFVGPDGSVRGEIFPGETYWH